MQESPRKTIRVVAAVIERGGQYLITQRRPNAVLPLMWEFPGGRCEDGETDAEALVREVKERLDVDVEVGQLISFVSHPYEHYTVDLYLYECRLLSEALRRSAVNDFRWVTSAEFDDYTFTPADEASMAKLLGEATLRKMDDTATPQTCPTCDTAIPEGRLRCPGCGRVFGERNRCPACHAIAPSTKTAGGLACLACGAPREASDGLVVVPSRDERIHTEQQRRVLAVLLRLLGIALVSGGVLGASLLASWVTGQWAFVLGAVVGGGSVALGAGLLRAASRMRTAVSSRYRAAKEQALLSLVESRGGVVTVTDVARRFGETFADAERFLSSLVDENRVALEVRDDGVLLYRFREVLSLPHGVRVAVTKGDSVDPSESAAVPSADSTHSSDATEDVHPPARRNTT